MDTPRMTPDTLADLDALLRQPDPDDLRSQTGASRGARLVYRAYPALRERTFRMAVDAHLAERRGWHAAVTRDAAPRRRLRLA